MPADSLSSERSTAPVRVLRSEEDPAAFLEEWAQTLGLQGEPMAGDDDFFPEGNVGLAEAETGRMISASTDGGSLHVSYSDVFSSPYCREELAMAQGRERDTMQDYWEATFGSDTPLGRPGQPVEVAAAFVFLASDEASYVSGTVLGVTGGKPVF